MHKTQYSETSKFMYKSLIFWELDTVRYHKACQVFVRLPTAANACVVKTLYVGLYNNVTVILCISVLVAWLLYLGLLLSSQLTVFQPFFVSLNLPYSVIRGEEFGLQAMVFNYLPEAVEVGNYRFWCYDWGALWHCWRALLLPRSH